MDHHSLLPSLPRPAGAGKTGNEARTTMLSWNYRLYIHALLILHKGSHISVRVVLNVL